ncbi:MAG TPA: zinc ribbon domain-containing protein [Candidatus Omnitrophota bacterium]|nr:zinc ribbon domain-containing protein [Candidatus Omnitrophota bacterium]
MPTYQYECASCGQSMEIMQAITDAKLTQCPQCGQNTLQRLIGAGSGIIFKGNGFFETDYKRKSAKKDAPKHCPVGEGKSSSCPCSCDES